MDRKKFFEELKMFNSRKKEILLLSKRDEYYDAICEIAQATIPNGELLHFANTFLMEGTELLKKAIVVFEEGFFDCAFYLLRSANEVLLTLVYLAELPDEEREKQLEVWKKIRSFPSRKKMLDSLSKTGKNFAEMKEKMPEAFDEMQQLSRKVNKYAHKQGFDKFYVYREMYMFDEKSKNDLIREFEDTVDSSIKALAIMRLAIDPFPVLLMDEEIVRRTHDFATTAYSEEFINKYLTKGFVEKYKELVTYKSYYATFIGDKRQNDFVVNVIHNKFIDTMHIEEILSQKELLFLSDLISVLLIKYNSKVTNIYISSGPINYFSDRRSKSNISGYDSQDFEKFEENSEYMNQEYGNAFITRFDFPDGKYLVEHTALLNISEYMDLKNAVLNSLNSMEHLKETLEYCKSRYYDK